MRWDSIPPFSCLHTVSEGRKREHVLFLCWAECCELNCVPTKLACWNPVHQCDSIWRWLLWEIIRFRWDHECGVLIMGLGARKDHECGVLIMGLGARNGPETSFSLNVWSEKRPSEKKQLQGCCLPIRKKSPISIQPCWHLDLRFPVSRTVNKHMWFKACSPWYFLMATQGN